MGREKEMTVWYSLIPEAHKKKLTRRNREMAIEHIENAYVLFCDAATELEAYLLDAATELQQVDYSENQKREDAKERLAKIEKFAGEFEKLFQEMDSTFMEIVG